MDIRKVAAGRRAMAYRGMRSGDNALNKRVNSDCGLLKHVFEGETVKYFAQLVKTHLEEVKGIRETEGMKK